MPRSARVVAVEPVYPIGAGRGRPPSGLETMLRMYFAQLCSGLPDAGAKDAIYASQAIRGFVGIDLTHAAAAHAITLLRFRRLLEAHTLPGQLFALFGLAKRVNTYSATAN